MKPSLTFGRMAAVSAVLALGACDYYDSTPVSQHDPWQTYPLGSVYDCDALGQPDMRINTENAPTAGFGCAHNSNVTVMVADPNDLKRARALTPADAASRQRVVDAYRAGEDTATNVGAKGTQELVE